MKSAIRKRNENDLDERVVHLSCTRNREHWISAPFFIFDKKQKERVFYPHGKVREEYRDREFDSCYVSPNGFIYCNRKCFAEFCDD